MSLSDFLARFSVVEEFIKRREEFLKNLVEEKGLEAYFVNSNLAIIVFFRFLWCDYGRVSWWIAGFL